MTQAKTEPKLYNFDEFISWYPDSSEVRYELHDGVIVEMPKPRMNPFTDNTPIVSPTLTQFDLSPQQIFNHS